MENSNAEENMMNPGTPWGRYVHELNKNHWPMSHTQQPVNPEKQAKFHEMLAHTTEQLELGGPKACQRAHCYATFTDQGDDHPTRMACNSASGGLPLQLPPANPMYYPGNYEWCNTFPNAHYCTVQVEVQGYALAMLGQCVSKECSASDLSAKYHLPQTHKNLTQLFTSHLPGFDLSGNGSSPTPQPAPPMLQFTTRCADDVLEERGVGYTVWVSVFGFLSALVVIATLWHGVAAFFQSQRQTVLPEIASENASDPPVTHHHNGQQQSAEVSTEQPVANGNGVPEIVMAFSAVENTKRLWAPMGGDFTSLNGIRVLSILWVIYGHTVLSTISIPVGNPTSMAPFTQDIAFTSVKSAEFAVDTFFFLSAFLATSGAYRALKSQPLTPGLYLKMLFVRYIRLTPAYAMVLFFFYMVAPFVSSGPFWNLLPSNPAMSAKSCRDYWWTNLLYINNLHPLNGVGLESCLGWAWYLANDFQFFLLVAPVVALFTAGLRKSGRAASALLCCGPVIALVLIQLTVSVYLVEKYDMTGTVLDAHFFSRFYNKPYCRVTPYAVGMGLALMDAFRRERSAESNGLQPVPLAGESKSVAARRAWFLGGNPVLVSGAWVGAVAVMLWLVVVVHEQFRCLEDKELNCYSPTTHYGFFGVSNWDTHTVAVYYAGSYLVWSVCLAVVCYSFFAGYGTWVSAVLSHGVFTPFARLTYGAYLVHLGFMFMQVYSSQRLSHFGWSTIVPLFVYYSCAAFAISFVLYLVVEKPTMRLLSLALGRGAARVPKPSTRSQQQLQEPLLGDSHPTNQVTVS